jgi:hypothetical protein
LKLLIMKCSPFLWYFVVFGSKYSVKCFVLEDQQYLLARARAHNHFDVIVVPKWATRTFTCSDDLLAVFVSWFCPVFWRRDLTIHLVFFLVSICRLTSLLVFSRPVVSVFFFMAVMFLPNKLTSSVHVRIWRVPFSPSGFLGLY